MHIAQQKKKKKKKTNNTSKHVFAHNKTHSHFAYVDFVLLRARKQETWNWNSIFTYTNKFDNKYVEAYTIDATAGIESNGHE